MGVGSLVIVLHGHLPYVLHHGEWPHGEDWLYEAAVECYLPLLQVIGHCALYGRSPKFVVGLTPVLLEQLAHEHFAQGLRRYLGEQIQRARDDRATFEGWGDLHLRWLAERWERHFEEVLAYFETIGGDIPGAFAARHREGHVQVLTSAATHGYLPLLWEDSSIRAQIRAGRATSRRILGVDTRGAWLPECAYRPAGPWWAPNGWGRRDWRPGIEQILLEEGITHTFVENHLVGDWRLHEPYRVGHHEGRALAVFARDREVCEHVWSGDMGYPADGTYLEFHKRHGPRRGLRYWKITGNKVDLGLKHPYYPDDVPGKLYEHSQHFRHIVRERLWKHHHHTGGRGVVVATFDLELFGHWWHEGPRFLRDLVLACHDDPDIDLQTAEEVLAERPPVHAISLPEGSWGDKGDHRVWANDRVRWMWDVQYRCELDFGRATRELPWSSDPVLEDLLRRAGRELLLLQASDWIFVITRDQAVDYGIRRFSQHAARFDNLLELARRASREPGCLEQLTPVERLRLAEADAHDDVFKDVDLAWWS